MSIGFYKVEIDPPTKYQLGYRNFAIWCVKFELSLAPYKCILKFPESSMEAEEALALALTISVSCPC
jgi:hypothetical protein